MVQAYAKRYITQDTWKLAPLTDQVRAVAGGGYILSGMRLLIMLPPLRRHIVLPSPLTLEDVGDKFLRNGAGSQLQDMTQ